MGKLLSQRATPGHADGIDLAVVQVIQHAGGQLGEAGEAVGRVRCGRATNAGYIKGDDFQLRVEGLDERHDQLEVGANTVENQQRRELAVAGTYRRADGLAIQFDGTECERLRHALSPMV